MARAGLGWRVEDLARRAKVARNTVTAFEAARAVRTQSIYRMQAALERGGAAFAVAPKTVSVHLVI